MCNNTVSPPGKAHPQHIRHTGRMVIFGFWIPSFLVFVLVSFSLDDRRCSNIMRHDFSCCRQLPRGFAIAVDLSLDLSWLSLHQARLEKCGIPACHCHNLMLSSLRTTSPAQPSKVSPPSSLNDVGNPNPH